MEENIFWLKFWSIIGVCVVAIAITIAVADTMQTKMYTDRGYEQVVVVGSNTYKWQKVK